MDLTSGFVSLSDLTEERVSPEMTLRNITTGRGVVKFWRLKAGLHPTPHHHPEEQISWILSGRVEFRVGSDRRLLGPNDMVVIAGGVEHEGRFIEDTEMVSIFLPPP
jgi:quercetin dioxygenase-like cupin family protein